MQNVSIKEPCQIRQGHKEPHPFPINPSRLLREFVLCGGNDALWGNAMSILTNLDKCSLKNKQTHTAVGQKWGNPKMACPGKWKQRRTPLHPGALILSHPIQLKRPILRSEIHLAGLGESLVRLPKSGCSLPGLARSLDFCATCLWDPVGQNAGNPCKIGGKWMLIHPKMGSP